MGLFSNIFTWWHGPGIGTALLTRRHGREVGRDDAGNVYFRRGSGPTERRWVIYNGVPEASRIPPEWHLWMHKTTAVPPSEAPQTPRVWERAWTPNATGTEAAHMPSGSLAASGQRARAAGDYRAWSPEGDLSEDRPEGDLSEDRPEGDLSEDGPEGDLSEDGPEGDLSEDGPEGDPAKRGSEG